MRREEEREKDRYLCESAADANRDGFRRPLSSLSLSHSLCLSSSLSASLPLYRIIEGFDHCKSQRMNINPKMGVNERIGENGKDARKER